MRLFALDLNAVQIAALCALSRNSVNRYLRLLRERMAAHCETSGPLSGEIEVDESYFGARRARQTWARGERQDRRFRPAQTRRQGNRPGLLQSHATSHYSRAWALAVMYSDRWRACDGLVDVGYGKHFRIARGRDEWVRGEAHINGIEGFWGFAKSRLAKFRGMRRRTFYLHLKECEFRFNHRHEEVYQILLTSCRKTPLNLS